MKTSTFKKIVWSEIVLLAFAVLLSIFAPFQSDYSEFEEQLHAGFLIKLSEAFELSLGLILLLLIVVSWVLLLRLHHRGPLLYTTAMIFGTVLSMLMGDEITYGLFYPLDWVSSAITGIILYVIHFTPLKGEFSRRQTLIQNE